MALPEKGASAPQNTVAIGKIVGAHGVKGEIKLLPYAERGGLDAFIGLMTSAWDRVYIDGTAYVIKSVRKHKGMALVTFEGLSAKREDIAALAGKEIFADREKLPALTEDEYYHEDLIGMDVVGEGGEPVGKLTAILSTAGNDVYEVKGKSGDILIPAVTDVVAAVDVKLKKMTVRLGKF